MSLSLIKTLHRRLLSCDLCPRNCSVNRVKGELGFCKTESEPLVASVFLHYGEEPVISGKEGICNVFFAHCNLSCTYCQNYQISDNKTNNNGWLTDFDAIINRITAILSKGTNRLGFVSPTHQVAQMVEIVYRLNQRGFYPTIIYNTNTYDNPEVLRLLENIVDVYLPDVKYFSNKLSNNYSNVNDYWIRSQDALKEMVWQKGTSLTLDDNGYVTSGVIIRHLVLPVNADDSVYIFKSIADTISTNINISLMSQFFPTPRVKNDRNLSKTITSDEYDYVTDKLIEFGFHRIWLQELDSSEHYKPNFSKKNPFK